MAVKVWAMLFELVPQHVPTLLALSFAILTAFWLRYVYSQDKFMTYQKRKDAKEKPLVFPYFFPLLGSLPFGYLLRPRDFVLSPDNFFQSPNPTLVKILTHKFYVVQGTENVKALFKNSWTCTSIPFVKFALSYAFGLPAKAQKLYDRDDSGGSQIPIAGSTVDAHNRVDFLVYQSLGRFLEGPGLSPFWKRFEDNITQQLYRLHDDIGPDWTSRADLIRTVGDETTIAILNALCGKHLLGLNSSFLQDYWEFDRNLQTYLQGIPWCFAPKAYRVRKRVLGAVKVWQQHARDNFDESTLDVNGDDPYWGSNFFRERHKMFLKMDGFDHDAIASEDFGAIWAARNSITAASWTIFELYRDPELLAGARAEVDTCALKTEDGSIRFDIDRLLHLPLLQAVYAETLRLRMHFYIIRMPDRFDMNMRDWIIPKRNAIVTLTTVAHMDRKAWNSGSNNEHPVDQFWAGRFLHYPSEGTESKTQAQDLASSPTFSTKELEGSWIPYGGGPRQCPGRHFAKRQILLTAALMISLYDCELLEEGRNLQEDFTLGGFGSGISHPIGKVPIRIRHRKN